jgi:tRNA wybutosine-synthesizing protein 4
MIGNCTKPPRNRSRVMAPFPQDCLLTCMIAEFCLLEQLLPHGPDHPFAATMLSHFDKLKTPPKSVRQYPALVDQVRRFTDRCYSHVRIWDLWEAWSNENFVSSSERAALDEIEPFDEWEEFALFGRHYFVIHASATLRAKQTTGPSMHNVEYSQENIKKLQVSVTKQDVQISKRRFGEALTIKDPTGAAYGIHLMGLGMTGRAETCDMYSLNGQVDMPAFPITGPIPRMCHSLTDLGEYGVLLVGGRTSPANALSDCWILRRGPSCHWVPASSLPVPLFRHSTVRLRGSSLALVVGGKTGPSTISEGCYMFHASKGWLRCEILGEAPAPVFGAILYNSPCRLQSNVFAGLLAGGIGQDGLISSNKYKWQLDANTSQVSRTSGPAIKICYV